MTCIAKSCGNARQPGTAPTVPSLGIGVTFQPRMRGFIERNLGLLDFVEIVPDMCWTDFGAQCAPRYVNEPAMMAWLQELRQQVPVIPHSIGLSIGSAHRFRYEHVEQMKAWHEELDFPWHSDHLAFNLTEHDATEVNVGVTMPIARDSASLDMLVPRIQAVMASIDTPFALENNVYFFDYDDQEFGDAQFLNLLSEASGCALVLDLHNLYTNARNHGQDARAFVDELNLESVIEIHMAGGMEHDGFYLDAHSGPSPDPVMELLEYTLPRCPNVGGINFEILGSWYEEMGEARMRGELHRLRSIWLARSDTPSRTAVAC